MPETILRISGHELTSIRVRRDDAVIIELPVKELAAKSHLAGRKTSADEAILSQLADALSRLQKELPEGVIEFLLPMKLV
ncbi:hypothetical protein [Planctomicrobium sp. SH527]|uniref:hypothetical protein n=1 Tax=Planctomicrobium sp. SH527 TaxID=3448123 RepID=UPI003F5BA980